MADIEIRAQAFWTHIEGSDRAAGFAASEDPEDGYVLFEGQAGGDPAKTYLEVSDEIFGAEDAVGSVVFSETGFLLTIKPAMAKKFGMVSEVAVHVDPADADGQAAMAVLRELVG